VAETPDHLCGRALETSQLTILALESAGLACSALVAVGNTILRAERVEGRHGQVEALLPIVEAVVRKAGLTPAALDLVAASVGPGSFTGIRVGLAAAHGIALATGARVVGVSSFEAVAAGPAVRNGQWSRPLLVALESRREDIYVQLFDRVSNPIGPPAAVMPAELGEIVRAEIGAGPLLIAGDAAQRAALAFAQLEDIIVLEASGPDAAGVWLASLHCRHTAEAGAPRPLYLRPPDVTVASRRLTPRVGRG
jgi:tRNA threonylcarbamoyladenosine biosynthesis protein TsaB